MKEYKFDLKKRNGVYEIHDADPLQNILGEFPINVPFGALVSFYQRLAEFCQDECIMGNSVYGNARDLPQVYAVLRDKECRSEATKNMFIICQNDEYRKEEYVIIHLVLDGPTRKYYIERKALHDLCHTLYEFLKNTEEPKVKVWADYVMNKMTEDVPLDYELFLKWLYYAHPECPCCYYEVTFDAYDRLDDHLSLRQNLDIAASYVKDHEHDYD